MTDELLAFGAIASLVVAISTAIAVLVKLRPETQKLTLSIAGDAVVVQAGVIKSLREEIERLDAQHKECEVEREADREMFEREINELRLMILRIDRPREPREE